MLPNNLQDLSAMYLRLTAQYKGLPQCRKRNRIYKLICKLNSVIVRAEKAMAQTCRPIGNYQHPH